MSNTNSLKELSNAIDERGLNAVKRELEEVFNADNEKVRTLREQWASVKESGLLPEDFTPELKNHIRENMIGALTVIQSHYKDLYKVMANIVVLLEGQGFVRYNRPLKDVITMMDTMDLTYREIDFLLSEMEDSIQEREDTRTERDFIARFLDQVSGLLDEIDTKTATEEQISPIQTGVYDVQRILERIRTNVSQTYYDTASHEVSNLQKAVERIQSAIQMRNAPPGPAYSAAPYRPSTFRSAASPFSPGVSYTSTKAAAPPASRFTFPKAAAAPKAYRAPTPPRGTAAPPAGAAGPPSEENKNDEAKAACFKRLLSFGVVEQTPEGPKLKKGYKKRIFQHHPNRGGNIEIFQEIQACIQTIFGAGWEEDPSFVKASEGGSKKKNQMTKRHRHRKAKTQKTQKK